MPGTARRTHGASIPSRQASRRRLVNSSRTEDEAAEQLDRSYPLNALLPVSVLTLSLQKRKTLFR